MNILKDKRGTSESVSMLGIVFVCAIIFACILGGVQHINKLKMLDIFANEMVIKASTAGMYSGEEIEKKYEELVTTTGLKPTYKFSTDYDDAEGRVQYGDTITLELILSTKLLGFKDFSIPQTLKTTATGQSMQYWKGVQENS